jgi:integrase
MNSLILKKPDATRGSGKKRIFRIFERGGEGKLKRFQEPRLDHINSLLLQGTIDRIEAEAQAKRLLETLRNERGERRVTFNQGNYKILETFWKSYKLRDLIDPDTAYHDFRRAVDAVGDLPIASASQDELQTALTKHKGNKQRRIAARLNSILKFLGRDVRVRLTREEMREIAYLTPEEVGRLTSQVKPTLASLIQVLFLTGLRLGEAMALRSSQLRPDGSLWVDSQVDKHGQRRSTKTRKPRKVFVLSGGDVALQKWIQFLPDVAQDRLSLSQAMRRESMRILKRDLCLHDLRHSYAVLMVSRGVSLSLVAQSLGNSILVCEKYYSGFVLSDEGIETIKRMLNNT